MLLQTLIPQNPLTTRDLGEELVLLTRQDSILISVPIAAHIAVSLNTIMQKPSESLHIYVSRYSRLHYAATDKTV